MSVVTCRLSLNRHISFKALLK